MKRVLGLSVILVVACSRPPEAPPAPVVSPTTASTPVAAPSPADPITGQVWLRTDPGVAAGDLLAFLSGGSLLMTSCGEPYRLARWQREGDTLQWDEDGEPIRVRVLAVDADSLQLEFQLRGGPEIRSYRASREARVCPDLER